MVRVLLFQDIWGSVGPLAEETVANMCDLVECDVHSWIDGGVVSAIRLLVQ